MTYPDVAVDVVEILRTCNECHSFEQFVNTAGPTLNGVVGRSIAGYGYSGYSDALRNLGGVWDEETLKAFLVDPAGFAPGTTMPSIGLSEGIHLDALIAALKGLDTTNAEHLRY